MGKLTRLFFAIVLGITATLAIASPAQATVVSFSVTTSWSTGYVGEFTVFNDTSAPITGWGVVFDLAPTTTISTLWNGTRVATTPHHVIIATTWNGTIASGASVKVGFVAVGTDLPVVL
jgi:cellulase/cellobiase CelA1